MNGNGAITFYTDLQDVVGPNELPTDWATGVYTWELEMRGRAPGYCVRLCRHSAFITNPDLWFHHWSNGLLGADAEPES